MSRYRKGSLGSTPKMSDTSKHRQSHLQMASPDDNYPLEKLTFSHTTRPKGSISVIRNSTNQIKPFRDVVGGS